MKIVIDGYVVLIDDDFIYEIQKHAWRVKIYPNKKPYCYRSTNIDGVRSKKMHRVVIGAPNGMQVDHINGDTIDNRKCNLRICTHSQNQHNRGKYNNNKSGYKGVYWYKPTKKWKSQISLNGKRISLGYFVNIEDAYNAYKEAATRLHGEFAHF